jgi:8-oxo-dGTP pyrophosphatase MutT (NUDIX family)
MSKYKTSYGLALCRYNKKENNCIEILSIKKRFTYNYFSFVHGFYKKKNTRNFDVKFLFDNMSFQEKLTILTMNYGNMWWYIWLNNPEKGIGMFENDIIYVVHDYTKYFKHKNKFEKRFLSDGGKQLQELINNSKCNEPIWEIPKGSSDNSETNLETAIREFTEESQIDFEYYNILYDVEPIIFTYKDNGVSYKYVYYLAELNELGYKTYPIMKPKLNFKSYKQLSEVSDIKWINLSFIKLLNNDNKKKMMILYEQIIKKFKKYCKIKPHMI